MECPTYRVENVIGDVVTSFQYRETNPVKVAQMAKLITSRKTWKYPEVFVFSGDNFITKARVYL